MTDGTRCGAGLRSRRTVLACAAAVVLLMAGCSATSSPAGSSVERTAPGSQPGSASAAGPPAPATPSRRPMKLDSTADLETAVRIFSDASMAGDDTTAARLLSRRCSQVLTVRDIRARRAAAGAFYAVRKVTARVRGDRATVSYTFSLPRLDVRNEPWLREGGQWRRDAC